MTLAPSHLKLIHFVDAISYERSSGLPARALGFPDLAGSGRARACFKSEVGAIR